ncbi:unnamed protein product [Linum trigynum]|uniref:Uncharacterized protein n=1 Tax=Linum trigynum TaxID=586398 RepID=A0AAV2EVR1_9ROSI
MDHEQGFDGASSRRESVFMRRLGRRRRITGYHRLHSSPMAMARRPKLKVARLGGIGGGGRGGGPARKKWWRSNMNMLSAFHKAYVRVMLKLAAQFRKECRVFGGKKIAGRNQIWELPGGDRIDDRVLVEFCKRLMMMASSGDHDASQIIM